MYVFFPLKRVGTSVKFTSYWKGPFQVVGKMSDVLYNIDWGKNRSNQVIDSDRIRRCLQQVLKANRANLIILSVMLTVGSLTKMTHQRV